MRDRAMPGELDRLADQARSLREWFRVFVRERKGRTLGAADLRKLEPLNLLLARDEAFGKIVAHEETATGALTFERTRRWSSPESLLLPIGEILAKLVCQEDFTYVKACEGPTCTLLFADHTRGHARAGAAWQHAVTGRSKRRIGTGSRSKVNVIRIPN